MNNTTPKPNILRAAAIYGLYIGLFLILCHLLLAILGAKMGYFVQLIKLVGSIMLLVYGMKRYRDIDNRGFITYGNAFGFGMLTSLCSTLLYTAYFFVSISVNKVTLQEQLYLAYDDFIESGMITEEMVELVVENMDWFLPVGVFIWSMLFGLIYSLIISATIVRKESIFTE